MTLKTKLQLCNEVLWRSGLVSRLQNPPSEEVARVRSVYDTKLEEWRDRNLVYWTNTSLTTEEIPLAPFDTLVDLMINEVNAKPVQTREDIITKRGVEEQLLRALRRHTHMQSGGHPVKASYF